MKRSIVVGVGIGIFVIATGCYFWQSNNQMAIAYIQQEIQTCTSLNFSPSSALITLLTSYRDELFQANNSWNISWFCDQTLSKEKLAALVAINSAMLKSYVYDVQEYMKMKLPTSNTLMRFAYDKVVRLTIALAELEKDNELLISEYTKKVDRMREITKQAIAHSKKTLRAYLYNGLHDTDSKMQYERLYLTSKMQHLIALERISRSS